MVYTINVGTKIDRAYDDLIIALNEQRSSEELKKIINIYPNFPKMSRKHNI